MAGPAVEKDDRDILGAIRRLLREGNRFVPDLTITEIGFDADLRPVSGNALGFRFAEIRAAKDRA